MSQQYPTTLFKDGTDREDTIIVSDAHEVAKAAPLGYFPYGQAEEPKDKPKRGRPAK